MDNFIFIRRVYNKSRDQTSCELAAAAFIGHEFYEWALPLVPHCELSDLIKMWERGKDAPLKPLMENYNPEKEI
jgi:hypothetical protein